MALPSSGAISLNQMHVEVGGSSGTAASINDSDIRGLAFKSSGAQMSFNEFYGKFYNQRSFSFTCGTTSFTPAGAKFPVTYQGWDPAGYFISGAPVSSIGSGSPQFIRYNGGRIIRILACVANVGFTNSVNIAFDSVNPSFTLVNNTPTLSALLGTPSGFLTDSGNTVRYATNAGLTYQDAGTTRYRSILNFRDINFAGGTGSIPASGNITMTFS